MNKRALAKTNVAEPSRKLYDLAALSQGKGFTLTADRKKVDGADTLILTYFRNEGDNLICLFRVFCQTSDYITLDYREEQPKWRTASVPQEKLRHNHKATCPHCRRESICKSAGRGRDNLYAIHWSTLLESHNGELLVRSFCHTKDLTDFRHPKYTTGELCRSIYGEKKTAHYEWCYRAATDRLGWNLFRDWLGIGTIMPSPYIRPYDTAVYMKNLPELLVETHFRYSALDIYLRHCASKNENGTFKNGWVCEHYINTYRLYPQIEKLLKVGLYEIVREKMETTESITLNENDSVIGVLGLNKTQYRMLKTMDKPNSRAISILRDLSPRTVDDFHILCQMEMRYGTASHMILRELMQYTTPYRLERYLSAQSISHLNDYKDYVDCLKKLDYDVRNRFNLFPKNFVRAHDEKSAEYIARKDAIRQEEQKRFDAMLTALSKSNDIEPLQMKTSSLFIRLPYQLDELKKEGEALHHCVGTYISRVAEGQTMIFFIRRQSEPDKPYYTLEWNGRIVQCRGFHNQDMTEEVKQFAAQFDERMKTCSQSLLQIKAA